MSANDPTISSIMGSLQTYNAVAQNAAQQSSDLDSDRAGLADANALLYGAKASNDATISAAATSSQLQTEAANARTVQLFGTDINDQASTVNQLGSTVQSAAIAKMAALQTINQKKSVQFLDDPMQWISNQFTIDGDVKQYNAANSTLNAATDTIDQLNKASQSQMLTNKQNETPVTVASADAATANAAILATADANKSRIDAGSYDLDGINQVMKYTKDQVDSNFQALNAQTSIANLQLARDRLQQDQLEWPMRVKMMQDQLDNEEGQRAVGQGAVDDINKGIDTLGGTRPHLTANEAKTVLFMLKNKSPLSQEWNNLMLIGQNTNATAVKNADGSMSTTPVVAASPFQLQQRLTAVNSTLPPEQQYAMKIAQNGVQTAINAADEANKATLSPYLQTVTRKDPQSIQQAANITSANIMANYAADVTKDPGNNPYNFGDINVVASSNAVQNLPLYQKVFAAPIAAGSRIPQQAAVEMAYNAYKSGQISSTEFQQIGTIFGQGQLLNNKTRNFAGLGYTPGTTNNLELSTGVGNAWGTPATSVVNMADGIAALTAANKRMAAEMTAARNYAMINSVPGGQ